MGILKRTLKTYGLAEMEGGTLYIYGAQPIAYGAAEALREMGVFPAAHVVTSRTGNPEVLGGIPVCLLMDLPQDSEARFLLAVPEYLQAEIRAELIKYGFQHSVSMDGELDFQLMKSYFQPRGLCFADDYDVPAIKTTAAEADDMEVYVAVSTRDKQLLHPLTIKSPFHMVQAGSASGDKVLDTEFRDDEGTNISALNRDYAELTVTYWAWKNRHPAIKGLAHYRRYLDLTERERILLLNGQVDVVLPLPFACWPDASSQYMRYNVPQAVVSLQQALDEFDADEAECAQKILKGGYIYQYNMLVARAEVFDDYAAWMFPRLERARELFAVAWEHKKVPDRVCGHLGELLTSLYFTLRRENLNIIHARKVWLT